MKGIFENVAIRSIVSLVPPTIEDNNMASYQGDNERVRKIINYTGVEKRHVCGSSEEFLDMCVSATEKVIQNAGWQTKDVDCLLLVTQSGIYQTPSTAFLIHDKLELSQHCLVFDINMGCTGYNIGFRTLTAILESKGYGTKGVFIVADDFPRRLLENDELNEQEFSHSLLFGTAAAATAVEITTNGKKAIYAEYSDGSSYDVIFKPIDKSLVMDGLAIYDFATYDVCEHITDFINEFNLVGKIDYYVFHQAQKSIIEALIDILQLDRERVLISYREFGNTSGASIPLSICNSKGKYKEVSGTFLLCGFGVGLSCGITYVSIDTDCIAKVKCYKEAE